MANPEVWLGDDGILRVDYGAFNVITLAVVQSAYAQQRKISQDSIVTKPHLRIRHRYAPC